MVQGSSVRKAQKTDTKERIIEAAFSFYRDFVFENVSLSKIAAKVGISKPAIFKHFKTKDSLVEAMDDRVFSHLTLVLQEMETLFREGRKGEALSHIIAYLARNREETYYLVSTIPRITTDAVFLQLRKRGVNLFNGIFNADGSVKDEDLYYLTVYASSTFLCFLMFWFSSVDAGQASDEEAISSFTTKFNTLFQNGLEGLGGVSDQAAIQKKCSEGMSSTKELNRTFVALAAAVEKKGLGGVTVEGIAAEMGLAKSSLYSSFKSKEEMIFILIDEELCNLYATVLKNIDGLQGYGDKVYALMVTSLLYFLSRPEIITIFQSIVLSGRRLDDDFGEKARGGTGTESCRLLDSIMERDLFPSLPDVGIKGFCQEMLLSWFFALPAMLYLHCRVHSCSEDEMLHAVGKMYRFMEGGLNGKQA